MKNIIFIITIIFTVSIYSQENLYKIIDSKTLLPIEYVNVYNKQFGTLTNSNGMFELKINDLKDSLSISHISYKELKISKRELSEKFEIKLTQKVTELEEVVIYSIDNILDKIIKNLKNNYIDIPTNEYFFSRLTLFKNNNEGQLSEGYLNVNKSRYFDRSKDKSIKINLLSHTKINNLENVDFKYYSYEKLFEISESFINLKNGDYNFIYTNIGNKLLKISFYPKENIDPYDTIYNGYLIINKNDYAIQEFRYSIDSSCAKYSPEIEIKSGVFKKDINASKLVKWSINSKYNKYELSYLLIEDKLSVEENKKKDTYKAVYELQNLGYIESSYLPKKIKHSKPKKNVFEYSSFNTKSNIWEVKHPMIINEDQGNLLKRIND